MLKFSLKSTISIAIEFSRVTGGGGDIEDELSNEESRLLLIELLLTLAELLIESSSLTLIELLLANNRLDIFLVEKELKSKFLRG